MAEKKGCSWGRKDLGYGLAGKEKKKEKEEKGWLSASQ